MSIPPSVSYKGSLTLFQTLDDGTPITTVSTPTLIKRASIQPVKVQVPFKYRLKVWIYKGQVYSRVKGYRPKTIRFAPNAWRPPKPYVGSFSEGDVNTFNAIQGYAVNPAILPTSKYSYYLVGDAACSNYSIDCPAIPGFSSGLENEAVVKALGKLKGQSVNLAVAFAERHETAELLIGTLAGLSKAARSLRRGDMRGVARGLGLKGTPKSPKGQTFAQKWLELQYGWKPLYADVYGCVDALNQRDMDDAKRYTVSVKASVKRPFSESRSTPNAATCCNSSAVGEGFEGAFVRLDYYLENPLLASLASLGITNPLEVLWERVPFSFVVDWFLPVGRYLSALDADLGYSFRAGSCTRLFRRDWRGWIYPGAPRSPYRPTTVCGAANVRQLSINRSVYSKSPLPRVPGFKNPFPQNGVHIANAFALFASSLRG